VIASIEDPPVIDRILNHLARKDLPGMWPDSRAPPVEQTRSGRRVDRSAASAPAPGAALRSGAVRAKSPRAQPARQSAPTATARSEPSRSVHATSC
jgi:hypothetical protein